MYINPLNPMVNDNNPVRELLTASPLGVYVILSSQIALIWPSAESVGVTVDFWI